jgi:gamma-glutamylputrescine oxidase
VILACNGYLGGLEPQCRRPRHADQQFHRRHRTPGRPRAAEMLAENVAVADTKFVVNYWRLSEDGRLLFGGGETLWLPLSATLQNRAQTDAGGLSPAEGCAEIDYAWGGTLAITLNRMPCFRPAANVLSASGYSGHGVALATLAGKLMAEATARTGGGLRSDGQPARSRAFPADAMLRWPLLVLAMTWYSTRDRIGF